MPIRAVVFDAVGTLIHVEPSAAAVYSEVGRRHGSGLGADEVRRRFGVAFHRQDDVDRANNWITNEEREERRWREIVAEVLDDVADMEKCFAELYGHFAKPASWRVDADAAPVLDELSRRGLILAMASNFDSRLNAIVAGQPELVRLRHLIISSEVGHRKPGGPFFDAAKCRLGVESREILFIGDDLINDYHGATAAGFHAALLDLKHREYDVRRIGRLNELLRGDAQTSNPLAPHAPGIPGDSG